MRLIIVGIYGMTCAGKSTLGMELSIALTGSYLSFGDMRRDEVAKKSLLGRNVEQALALGHAIPADLCYEIVKGKFVPGFNFISGYPISEPELAYLSMENVSLDGWILLTATDDIIKKRHQMRAECPVCHRPGEVGLSCHIHALPMQIRVDANDVEVISRKRLLESRIMPFLQSDGMISLPHTVIDTTNLPRGEVVSTAIQWLQKCFTATQATEK